MVFVTTEILVRQGDIERFLTACGTALRHITDAPGCRFARLTRSVGDPSRFVVLSEWDCLESFHQGFCGSEHFVRWREAVSRFFLEPPRVEQLVEAQDTVPLSHEGLTGYEG
ncbi:MAG: antibiotic biosynthesis monooxygenase [Pseudonocardiaceae bacterium]|nr:antibiotic biosynthesis monooxygenase [Pseudonocardiaceae bacterium]